MIRTLVNAALAAGTLLAFTPSISSAAPALGSVLRVNDRTAGDQSSPAVARTGDGGFVVAWEGEVQNGGVVDIFARRFSAAGAPLGASFKVNSFTANRQALPSIAANASGQFVVVWDSNGQDSTGINVYFQRFRADGTPVGSETRVNNGNIDAQLRASVAMDDAGNVVIAWPERQPVTPLASNIRTSTIEVRLFDADNNPRTAQTQVDFSYPTNLRIPSVAMTPDGGFVVSWQASPTRIFPLDGVIPPPKGGIYARRYNAAGSALGAEFQVDISPGNTSYVDRQSIAVGLDGGFVIAFERISTDFLPLGIFARRYDAAGNAIGVELPVGPTPSLLRYPSVMVDTAGNFTIAAQGGGIFAQRFSASGAALGDLARIDVSTPDYALVPVLAGGASANRVTAVWQDFGTNGDGDGRGISARLLTYP